jgi:hypothetical protein
MTPLHARGAIHAEPDIRAVAKRHLIANPVALSTTGDTRYHASTPRLAARLKVRKTERNHADRSGAYEPKRPILTQCT